MIKVLYLPLNAGSPQQAMYDAWNEFGVNLLIFDFLQYWENNNKDRNKLIKEFLRIVKEFQPQLIHMQLQLTGIFTPESLIEARRLCKDKVVITNWTGDIRDKPSQEMIHLSPHTDYTLISSTGQIDAYEKAGGKNIKYWQIGYDPKLFYPKNKKEFKYDLAFTGNKYRKNDFIDSELRIDLIEYLKNKLKNRFALFGMGWSNNVRPTSSAEEVNDIYNDSRCILNISHYNDVAHYFSDRLLTCLASGRPVISYRFPKCESYFIDGQDILLANDKNQILDILKYCTDNPEYASDIGRSGGEKVKREHTYFSRVVELLRFTNLL